MELRLLAAALRRRLVVILLGALIGVAVAALFLAAQTRTYRATSSLLLDPLAVTTPLGQPFTGDPERYISAQMRILEGQELAQIAAERVPGVSAESLREGTSVTHTVGSDVVEVTAEAPSAAEAQALANAVGESYVDQRAADTAARTKAVVDQVNEEATTLQSALAALRGTTPAVESQRQLLLPQYQQVLERRRSVTAPGATRDSTRVLDLATTAVVAERLPRPATLGAGAVGGALVMLALSVLAEALTPRVTQRRQLERVVKTPVLVSFPRSARRGAEPRRVVRRLLPPARTLAALVSLAPHEGKRRIVAVCGVTKQAGTTTVAAALAEAFAEQGGNVVVVQTLPRAKDGDAAHAPHEGPARRREEVRSAPWQLNADAQSAAGIQSPEVSTVAWTGYRPPQAHDLATLVDELPPVHDVVLLDLPAVLASPLPAAVTPWVQDVVLVVRLPDELERDVELAHGMLSSTRQDLRMLVVGNKPPRMRSRLP